MSSSMPARKPSAHDALINMVSAEHRSLSLYNRMLCSAHLIALPVLMFFFCSSIKCLSAHELEELVATKSSDASYNSFRESLNNIQYFFTAACRVNPLYTVIPFVCFTAFSLLNMTADRFLKCAPRLAVTWNYYYSSFTRDLDPRSLRHLTLDILPLVLTPLCLIPTVMISFMALNTVRPICQVLWPKPPKGTVYGIECLRIKQQIDESRSPGRLEFFNAPWFNWVAIAPYLFGLPALVSLYIYWHLGVDPLLGYPSACGPFFKIIGIIQLYIYGLGWCVSTLFFRSYFTFVWNFTSSEYEIELYPDMIKKLPIKGWFLDFITARQHRGLVEVLWKEITNVQYGGGKLKPELLKDSAAQALFLPFLRKLASLYEGVADKLDVRSEKLTVSGVNSEVSFNLWEMSVEQKAQLFRMLRTYAPSVHLDANVQQSLIGTSVLRAPRYTDIWFSVLSSTVRDTAVGELTRGDKLQQGRYSVKSKISAGGQSVVYQAINDDGDMVVLKEYQLTPGESLDVMIESARDFENESSILSQLAHPAIVKPLDMFFEKGRIYIVLEHVKGKTLRQMINERGALSATQVVSLAKQMCFILDYLHKQVPSVVHRDFTPDNIIVQPNGQLKLIDFSVSQRLADRQSTNCVGKHSYTPPEQFRGDACTQSDIYALGATVYYLATGHDPVPISNSTIGAKASQEMQLLNSIISNCTQLNLSQRYENVSWVMNDLQALAATLPAARLALGKGSFQRTMSSVREKIVLRESGSDWQKIRRETAGHKNLTNPI